jgi:hypothetical protein
MGYSVEQSDAIFGFRASLSDLNSINGILNLFPIAGSRITYLHFSIILIKASTVDITLKYLGMKPII